MFTSRLAAAAPVRLDLYNVAGRRVRNLVRDTRLAGEYADRWDGEDDDGRKVPAGVYFARLEANGQKVSRSFVVLP
jgi:flagellar hook assembly protein FlgD